MLTAAVALPALLYAGPRFASRAPHFHAFFQFQLAGLNGAFLTADLFNLFVCFELLLIASYALLLHGAGAKALGAGFRYVVVNLVASSLFLVAVEPALRRGGHAEPRRPRPQAARARPGEPRARAGRRR